MWGKILGSGRWARELQERDSEELPTYPLVQQQDWEAFIFLDDTEVEEIENPGIDFASEMPTLVLKEIFQHLDVTSIQNCRKVCLNWNNAIIEMPFPQIWSPVLVLSRTRGEYSSKRSWNLPPFFFHFNLTYRSLRLLPKGVGLQPTWPSARI